MARLLIPVRWSDGPGQPRLDEEELTGFLIDYATALGWVQGFSTDETDRFTWQINDASWGGEAWDSDLAVVFSLPRDRTTSGPWAGMTSTVMRALERLGVEAPDSHGFDVDLEEVELIEEPVGGLFRVLRNANPHGDVAIEVELSSEFVEGVR